MSRRRFSPSQSLSFVGSPNRLVLLVLVLLESAAAMDIYALSGTWSFDSARSDDLGKAIETCLAGLEPAYRQSAGERLRVTNQPAPVLSIAASEGGRKVRLGTGSPEEVAVPVDGRPVAASSSRGEVFRRLVTLKPDQLIEVFEADDGRRTNTYRVAGDEKTLTVDVAVESGYLPLPLRYRQTYSLVLRPRR